jgi:ABC-type phosphate/phosphonate transport system substrate-binding protein
VSAVAGTPGPVRIAALPMYDFPELREAHDLLWSAIAERLLARGVVGVPQTLTRHLDCRETWRHPGLLLGQACEYPLLKSFGNDLRLVARPRYRAAGCEASSYRSAIVVRSLDSAGALDDLRHRRCVINEPDSNSGMNLLRAAVAPVAEGGRYFSSVRSSGSHQRSAELVVAEEADVKAIDCVTWAHLQRLRPLLTERLKVIGWTPASPCLPFVTSRLMDDIAIQSLRSAIGEVFADAALRHARELLLLADVDLAPDTSFARVLELERGAHDCRYPILL